MMTNAINFTAKVWKYQGRGTWYFATLTKDAASEIAFFHQGVLPFGIVPVVAEIKGIIWQTSIFKDTKLGSYILPLKSQVRKKVKIVAGDELLIRLTLRIN
jgi:Domain of unknown function (DUF1905)